MSSFLNNDDEEEEEEEEEEKMDTETDDVFGDDDNDPDFIKDFENESEEDGSERDKENAMRVEKDDEENVNKYEAVYINNYKQPHQTYCDNVMSGVIALLREDGVTSAVFYEKKKIAVMNYLKLFRIVGRNMLTSFKMLHLLVHGSDYHGKRNMTKR